MFCLVPLWESLAYASCLPVAAGTIDLEGVNSQFTLNDNPSSDILFNLKSLAVLFPVFFHSYTWCKDFGFDLARASIQFPKSDIWIDTTRNPDVLVNLEGDKDAWALRISFYGNDELGSIALANADNPVEAVNAMKAWLSDPKNKKVLNDARLSSGKNLAIDEYAQIVLNRARAIVVGRGTGEVNTELLDKIRTFDPELNRYVISGKLTLDDLPDVNNMDAIPAAVVGPEYKAGEPTRLLLSLKAWGASSKADAKAKAKAISARNKIPK